MLEARGGFEEVRKVGCRFDPGPYQGRGLKNRPMAEIRQLVGRSRLPYVLLAIGLAGCALVRKEAVDVPPVVVSPRERAVPPFKLGEQLTYDVYYGLIRAGTATLLVKDFVEVCGRPTYHILLTAKTSRSFSSIFKVDDTIETFIDRDELFPRKFMKVLHEGSYECDEETILDQENHMGHYRSNRSGYTQDYELPERCQDTLSVLYFLRVLPYCPGEMFAIKVMADEEIWDVTVQVKERTKRGIYGGGIYDTFLLVPDVAFDSGSLRKGSGRVWISADDRKLVVCVKTKLTFGYLTFALVKVENIYEGPERGENEVPLADHG